jgi:hypothetical protein
MTNTNTESALCTLNGTAKEVHVEAQAPCAEVRTVGVPTSDIASAAFDALVKIVTLSLGGGNEVKQLVCVPQLGDT